MKDNGLNAKEWERKRMAYMLMKAREVQEHIYGEPVVCVETGVLYASEAEAAKAVHVSRSDISRAVTTGRRVAWFHWARPGHTFIQRKRPNRKSKKVICVESGDVYPSIADAAKAMGVHTNAIHSALYSGTLSCGYHWQFVGGELNKSPVVRNRPIRVMPENKVFPTVAAAAQFLNTHRNRIYYAVKHRMWYRRHWFEYTDQTPDTCQASLTAAGVVPAAL